jgi:WD40 repeat protein
MRRWILPAVLIASLVILVQPDHAHAQTTDSTLYQSYLAHVAAASASLRLNETGEAKRWLTAAPEAFKGWEWKYLSARSDNSLASTELSEVLPTRVSWSADGAQIILPMSDGSIRFLDARTLTQDRSISGHTSVVYDARMSTDGRLVSCARGGLIRCWDVVTGDSLWAVQGGGQGLADVDFSPDGKQIAYSSWIRTDSGVVGIVSRWDAATGEKLWSTDFGDKPIVVCRYSPDGKHLAVGTWGWRVAVWTFASSDPPIELDFDDVTAYSAIDDIAWTSDSKAVLSATKNGTPRVWDISTGKLRFELRGHTRPVASVACSPDGARFYTGGDDGTIKIWSTIDGALVTTLYGHTNEVRSLSIRASDGRLASYSIDKSIRVWDGTHGSEFSEMSVRNRYNYTLPITVDGSKLASAGPEGSVTIWDADGLVVKNIAALSDLINDAAFSPDGRLIGTVNWDSTVRILDIETGTVVKELSGLGGGSSSCAFSHDGLLFAAVSTGKQVVIWDVATGSVARRLGMAEVPYRLEFSRDGKWLAVGDRGGAIVIWNATSLDSIATIATGGGTVLGLDFSVDGWLLASASDDGVARVWRMPAGEQFAEYKLHAGRVWDVAWHPDGSHLVTGSADLTARLWDTKTGQSTLILSDFTDPVINLVFSPDGKRLYTSAGGTDLLIFDAVSHRERLAIREKSVKR